MKTNKKQRINSFKVFIRNYKAYQYIGRKFLKNQL